MRHHLASQTVLSGLGTGTDSEEWSRAVEMGGDNAVTVTYWSISVTTGSNLPIDVGFELQGSADLSNWNAVVTGMTLPTTQVPSYQVEQNTSMVVPWPYVRLKYTLIGTTGSRMMVGATLDTFTAKS
ncbi:MAG: hypothetical protein KC583_24800 [Myxococcales bacterium]|nr:hypothetical protein [Myxococcales bacterium]